MAGNFSPSVNIVRDIGKDLRYLPTNNSRRVYDQIASNFRSGMHSFNIIGSYGTGKSAFLLALETHLAGNETFFEPVNGQFNGCKKFKFINIVGYKGSFIEALAEELGAKVQEKMVLKALDKEYKKLHDAGVCLILVVDEFGKFLEHAASEGPGRELYFVQQLAEYANDASRNILFLTTLHQNFDAYAVGLQEVQRKEWEKVKGRLKEVTFNEPVEQLLHLAAEFISKEGFTQQRPFDHSLLNAIKDKKAFALLNEVSYSLVDSLYPFDLLSAMAMTLALQRYGQNERSLFNFLQAEEHLGLKSFKDENNKDQYYHLARVYDYLQFNFYSTLTSKYNPDFFQWSQLRNALERVETNFTKDIDAVQKLVKTIGLLNILGSNGTKIDKELISLYSVHCLGIPNAGDLIGKLEDAQIIRYQSFRERYKLFEGTDVNVDGILQEAKREIGEISNLAIELQPHFSLDYVPAKAATYKAGTPRIFRFEVTDKPVLKFDYLKEKEVDGIVNLLFGVDPDEIIDVTEQPILYGFFKDVEEIQDRLLDVKAVVKALGKIGADPVAQRELIELKQSQVEALNQQLNEELFHEKKILWFFNGVDENVKGKRGFNRLLSDIVGDIYKDTPVYRNELMNKTSVSSSIHSAKRQFIDALISNWNVPLLGMSQKRMPPEKTIYLALLKNTGLHVETSAVTADFGNAPTEPTFLPLWEVSCAFLEKAKTSKRRVSELVETLQQPPFGLKDGFIEFWLISFLFIKREDFALFKEGKYLPKISREAAELFLKDAGKYEVKTFNIEGIKLDLFNKYRELTRQNKQEKVTGSGFQETARPFLVFYTQLPEYTKKTKNLSHDAIAFRDTVRNAKELEKTFFEDLPTCFGTSMERLANSEEELEIFVIRIQQCIAELRSAYDLLLDRFEEKLMEVFGIPKLLFEEYRPKIQKRHEKVKEHLLMPRQKVLYSRLKSQLPDRKAWLNSLAQALIGKQLEQCIDEEEWLLYDRMQTAFAELDDLVELSQMQFDEEKEQAFKIEITTFEQQPIKRNIILSNDQQKRLKVIEQELRKALKAAGDPQLHQAALIKLLKDLL